MENKKSKINSRNPSAEDVTYEEFFQNKLSLNQIVKDHLSSKGLDWRFINAREYRNDGNIHSTGWAPYRFPKDSGCQDFVNNEDIIQRGDLILGVREKKVTAAYRRLLADKNQRYNAFNKSEAKKLRQMLREGGMGDSRVEEGYGAEDGD